MLTSCSLQIPLDLEICRLLYPCCACVHAWDNNTYVNGIAVVVTQIANNINGKVKGGP